MLCLPACLVAPLHSSTCLISGIACPALVGSDGQVHPILQKDRPWLRSWLLHLGR